jgi:putative membrane protein
LGVVVLWVGADWPIDRLSDDYLLSVHMLQHMLFSFVAAPLLLLGLPVWLLRMFIRGPKLEKVVRFATRPLVALVVFNAMIAFQHWPAIVNLAVANETFHLGLHVVLVASSLLMWWPVVEPLPEMRRLSEPGKMLYLFLQSIVPTVPASFLTFASRPIYSAYAAASHPWMSAVTDQRVAGLLMKIGGGLLLWTVIAAIFFRWNAREESGEVPEVAWEDFERELEVWDLRT